MIVQVDTKQITDLENRVEELTVYLTAAVAKQSKGTLTLTPTDLETVNGGSLQWDRNDTGLTFTYKKPVA